MAYSDITARFLDDHARLRGKSGVLEELALRVLRGDEDLGSALRLKGEEIRNHLASHMEWEERALLPVLKGAPGGLEVAMVLLSEHRTQRERLDDCLRALAKSERQPSQLARAILELTSWLERDMRAEEQQVLATLRLFAHSEPEAP